MKKLTPFLEVLTNSAEKNLAAMAPLKANETQKQLELEIAKADTARTSAEAQIAIVASKYPLDIPALMAAVDTADITERKYNKLKEVAAALFPAEAPKT